MLSASNVARLQLADCPPNLGRSQVLSISRYHRFIANVSLQQLLLLSSPWHVLHRQLISALPYSLYHSLLSTLHNDRNVLSA